MEHYKNKPQGEFRRRKVFSVGIIITDTIEWTGKWFKFIEIEEEKCLVKFSEFDEWTYTFHWGEWKPIWEFRKIIE